MIPQVCCCPQEEGSSLLLICQVVRQAFVPILAGTVVQPSANLENNFVRQITCGSRRFVGGNAMRDAVQECPCEHVSGSSEVFWFARERWYESFKPVVSNVGAM